VRGVEPRRAALATQAGMAAFGSAVSAWSAGAKADLSAHTARAFQELGSLSVNDLATPDKLKISSAKTGMAHTHKTVAKLAAFAAAL